MSASARPRYVQCRQCGAHYRPRSRYRHEHESWGCTCIDSDTSAARQITDPDLERELFEYEINSKSEDTDSSAEETNDCTDQHDSFTDFQFDGSTDKSADRSAFLREIFGEEVQRLEESAAMADLLHQDDPDVTVYKEQINQHVSTESADKFVSFTSQFLLKWQAENRITDRALAHFLRFQSACYDYLGKKSDFCSEIAKDVPATLPNLKKKVGHTSEFTRYVICEQCKSLYDYKDCYVDVGGKKEPKFCTYIALPNSTKRKRCGHPLLKVVPGVEGKPDRLSPYKEYYYQKLEDSLHRLVQRPGFEEKCEEWRQRKQPDNSKLMAGVEDGNIWKDFNGGVYDFLTHLRSYGLMLNLDFFQPYDHVNYSVGAIYIVVLNLPIEERFKKENVILVGLIPNFEHEPATNPFLKPLVDELLNGWIEGFNMTCHSSPDVPLTFKVALMCCGCDIPASRKVCGFVHHNATLGCNKCYKKFNKVDTRTDYSGFDVASWQMRDAAKHRRDVARITRLSKTKDQQKKLESQLGVRYSVLLELPYFDPIRMVVIDPMHNLFLGTGKHQLKVWKDHTHDLLPVHFERIQKLIDSIQVPSDVGRIPHKIASGFASLNADQLKNWILLFSLPALENILSEEKLKCWQKFVLVCKYLCTRVIDSSTLDIVQATIVRFCTDFQRLYGSQYVTPNMHLHCHLTDCVRDYGPIYGFWLFSFERYNGWIENYSTNKKNIEGQLMRRFMMDVNIANMPSVDIQDDSLQAVMSEFERTTARGTLLTHDRGTSVESVSMASTQCVVQDTDWTVNFSDMKLIKWTTQALEEIDILHLKSMYTYMYPQKNFEISPAYGSTPKINFRGHVLGSVDTRSSRSSVIYANWCNDDGDINTTHLCTTNRPGIVQEYMLHKVFFETTEKWHLLARVDWHASLTERRRERLRLKNITPTEQWSPLTVAHGPAKFIPVQRIKCTGISYKTVVRNTDIQYITPRQRYLLS